jgi:two-component system repressor protein LuxO
MKALYKAIKTVGPSRAPIFIHGESGTGKDLAADALHKHSPRAQQALIPINCASIPLSLIESELFGHVKGAFTGAHTDHNGAFIQADKGTLFLDEVADLDIQIQAKLLRVLQTGEVRRIGETKHRLVDVRIISATHRDLHSLVRAGSFRADLFYRLHVVPIRLPALRERGDDILLIAQFMLTKYAREDGRSFKTFSLQTQELLVRHTWPGNVRELINTIRAAVAMHDGEVIEAAMLRDPLHLSHQFGDFVDAAEKINSAHLSTNQVQLLAVVERNAIAAALNLFSGNVTQAAKALGVNPSTIHRKIATYVEPISD